MRHAARAVLVLAVWLALGGTGAAQTETVEYYGLDGIGSVRVVFDATGNVLTRLDYAPFGQELTAAPNGPDRKFAQLFRDGEAGLDYAEARSYQVRTGRFGAPDPIYDGLLEPQSWNRYAYSLNRPLSLVDPSGLRPTEDDCGKSAVLGDDNRFHSTTCGKDAGGGGGGGTGLGLADFIRFAFESIGRRQEPVRPFDIDWGRIFRERTAPGIVATAATAVVSPDSSVAARLQGGLTVATAVIPVLAAAKGLGVADDALGIGSTYASAKLYHYTDEASAELILQTQLGLPGHVLYLTSNGNLSSIQAVSNLALPPGHAATAVFEVAYRSLNPALIVRSGSVGSRFGRPGGGHEIVYNGTFPRGTFTLVR